MDLPRRGAAALLLLLTAVAGAAPASAAPATPAGTLATDLLPAASYPTFGDDQQWRRTATARTSLRGICVPLLPAGPKVTAVHALPGTDRTTRAAQTVVQLASPAAARAAGLRASARVRDCEVARTRTTPLATGRANSRMWSSITTVPRQVDGTFGYVGIGWRGSRMTVTHLTHGGQDSNFPDGTFQRWIRTATARLG